MTNSTEWQSGARRIVAMGFEDGRRKLTPMQEKALRSLPREYGRWWAPICWLLDYKLIELAEDRSPPRQRNTRGWFVRTELGDEMLQTIGDYHGNL